MHGRHDLFVQMAWRRIQRTHPELHAKRILEAQLYALQIAQQLRAGVRAASQHAFGIVEFGRDHQRNQAQIKPILVAEVRIDRRLLDTHIAGDLGHRRGIKTLACKARQRGVLQAGGGQGNGFHGGDFTSLRTLVRLVRQVASAGRARASR
ncbi:hypothetical protein D3C71_1669980 [compost metagenome]